jgi:hypothetical protein
VLAPHWFGAPVSWFESTSRSSQRRHPVVTRPKVTFLRLHPASEFGSDAVAPHSAGSLEVSRPLSATQPSRSTTPGLAFPGHVAPSRLPCASALYSLDGLPGILSTRRAHGVRPSELARTEIANTSRCGRPSCALPCRELANAVAGATGPKPTRGCASGVDPLPVEAIGAGFRRRPMPWLSWVSPRLGFPLPPFRAS